MKVAPGTSKILRHANFFGHLIMLSIPYSKPRYFRRSLPAVIDDATPIRLPRIKPLSPEDKWNEAIWKPNPVKITHQDRLPSMLVVLGAEVGGI